MNLPDSVAFYRACDENSQFNSFTIYLKCSAPEGVQKGDTTTDHMSSISRRLAAHEGLDSMVLLQISGGPFFHVSFRKGSRWTLDDVKTFVKQFQAELYPGVDATTAPASIVEPVCEVIEYGWLKLINSNGSSVEAKLKIFFGKEALVVPPSTVPPQSSSEGAGTPGAFLI
jgi:hypothetical protein